MPACEGQRTPPCAPTVRDRARPPRKVVYPDHHDSEAGNIQTVGGRSRRDGMRAAHGRTRCELGRVPAQWSWGQCRGQSRRSEPGPASLTTELGQGHMPGCASVRSCLASVGHHLGGSVSKGATRSDRIARGLVDHVAIVGHENPIGAWSPVRGCRGRRVHQGKPARASRARRFHAREISRLTRKDRARAGPPR
jgi:hypothetical protein